MGRRGSGVVAAASQDPDRNNDQEGNEDGDACSGEPDSGDEEEDPVAQHTSFSCMCRSLASAWLRSFGHSCKRWDLVV